MNESHREIDGAMVRDWTLRVLYDGQCPLCSREIAMLRRRDRGRGRIDFEDIADLSFDGDRYGIARGDAMARIHGVLPDGQLIEGMEVFRRAYAAVGLGWLLSWTRLPGLRRAADAGYHAFAKNRLRWTGRAEPCEIGPRKVAPRAGAVPARD